MLGNLMIACLSGLVAAIAMAIAGGAVVSCMIAYSMVGALVLLSLSAMRFTVQS